MTIQTLVRISAYVVLASVLIQPTYSQNVRVSIEVIDIHCNKDKNTEDVTGADEFYLVSALKAGKIEKSTVTTPIDINTGETKILPTEEKVLFSGDVAMSDAIEGGLVAFDEDFGKEWKEKHQTIVKMIAEGVAKGIASDKDNKNGDTIALIIQAVASAVDFFAQSDKDDKLGSMQLKIPAEGPSEEILEWKFEHADGIGFSDWSYVLRYRILRKK